MIEKRVIELVRSLDELEAIFTSHNIGSKKIFFDKSDLQSSLTQFAYGSLKKGQIIPFHTHETMEEVFYFLKGKGIYKIGYQVIEITKKMAILIPAKSVHSLV